MTTTPQRGLIQKLWHGLTHPSYLRWRVVTAWKKATGYNEQQWARVVMYRELFDYVKSLGPAGLDTLEISPGGPYSPWRKLGYKSYRGVDYPEFDICKDCLEERFDLIIADQVFEHLLWPYRAARNIHTMLKPGGIFINTTPFLIRIRLNPVDCSRWTETGMKYFLAEAGFPLGSIKTGAWGSLACVRANLTAPRWAKFGYGKSLRKDEAYPIAVWAVAKKSEIS